MGRNINDLKDGKENRAYWHKVAATQANRPKPPEQSCKCEAKRT